ncbi:hypothetical protein ABVK25_004445 [Lepraria finkii]|uniref:Dynein regulatory complex protein 10 n=1 Tax=Lepraria finkii TaxID=1340010 RepID=A0ABR4BB72_9LECA
MTLYLEAYYTPIKVSPPPNTSNNPTMSQPATISTSTPALDASTSTLVDELLKVIIDIGLTREEHEGLAHEIEKLATRRIGEAASTHMSIDDTSMVKYMLIYINEFVPTPVELLILYDEILELALTQKTEAEAADLARQNQLEKEQAEDYQTLKAQTERVEKHKREFEEFCVEMDKNVNRFL